LTRDPDNRLAVPTSHDEIARLARTLNELLDLLRGAIKRQREFVAVASHELRTPLSVLRAEVELARRRGRTDAEVRASLDVLGPRIDQLVRLSDDLLLLASGDEGALRLSAATQELEPLISSSLQSLSVAAQARGISLALDAQPGVAATVDTVRFHQIVENLVANALDHAATTPLVEVFVCNTPGGAVVEVQDRGPGFPDDFLPKAFDRFTRASSGSPSVASASADRRSPPRRGVGLGLAVVRLLVEAHGGSVEAANRAGGGARVVVTLPFLADASPPPDGSLRTPAPQPGAGCRPAPARAEQVAT
jgi:signal transduction histidine kinase